MRVSLIAQMVKNLPAVQETWVRPLGWEEPLEKGMATHSRILAWEIPWTEEPGGLQSMGPQRVGDNQTSSVLARAGAGCGSVGDVPGAWLASAPLWPYLWMFQRGAQAGDTRAVPKREISTQFAEWLAGLGPHSFQCVSK